MAVDLSGLKDHSVWRVVTNNGYGVLFVCVTANEKQFMVFYDDGGFDRYKASGLGISAVHRIESILHELKAPGDITAADLDGRVIETLSGVGLFFADGDVLINSDGEWGAGGTTWPEWADGCTTEADIQAAYLADLERRRNPPVEIVWQGECRDDDGTLLSAWCEVRGEKWRVCRHENGTYGLHCGRRLEGHLLPIGECEARIRERYKDRAASK